MCRRCRGQLYSILVTSTASRKLARGLVSSIARALRFSYLWHVSAMPRGQCSGAEARGLVRSIASLERFRYLWHLLALSAKSRASGAALTHTLRQLAACLRSLMWSKRPHSHCLCNFQLAGQVDLSRVERVPFPRACPAPKHTSAYVSIRAPFPRARPAAYSSLEVLLGSIEV